MQPALAVKREDVQGVIGVADLSKLNARDAEGLDLIPTQQHLAEAAKIGSQILINRGRMKALLGYHFVSDPGWEIFVELFVARCEYEDLQTSAIGVALGIPPTTALRWIHVFVDRGLAERSSDPYDGRKVYVRMSHAGMVLMIQLLDGMEASVL